MISHRKGMSELAPIIAEGEKKKEKKGSSYFFPSDLFIKVSRVFKLNNKIVWRLKKDIIDIEEFSSNNFKGRQRLRENRHERHWNATIFPIHGWKSLTKWVYPERFALSFFMTLTFFFYFCLFIVSNILKYKMNHIFGFY